MATYLICYDISKNKQRTKVSELLEKYGTRINRSVFECQLNKTQLENTKQFIEQHIEPKTDIIKYYYICKSCYTKSNNVGKTKPKKKTTNFI